MNLTDMTDDQLFDETVRVIWRAAAGSTPSYNYATTELLPESQHRLEAAGHDKWCAAGIYARAYEKATAEHASRTPDYSSCSCGKEA
jgi:hypothetical protein